MSDEVAFPPNGLHQEMRFFAPERHDGRLTIFSVEICDSDCRVLARIDADSPERMAALFRQMAVDWRGWDGPKVWEAVEHELRLSATTDRAGHVMIDVTLEPIRQHGWRFRGSVMIEAGQLDEIALQVEAFVAG